MYPSHNCTCALSCFKKQVPGQRYQPLAEVSRNCCRPIRDGWQTTDCDRYYYSVGERDDLGKQTEMKESRLVVQMDTEIPVIYQKICLEYNYKKPLQVRFIGIDEYTFNAYCDHIGCRNQFIRVQVGFILYFFFTNM